MFAGEEITMKEMIKEVRVPIGGLVRVIPVFGKGYYINSNGKIYTDLKEAREGTPYFGMLNVSEKDFESVIFPPKDNK